MPLESGEFGSLSTNRPVCPAALAEISARQHLDEGAGMTIAKSVDPREALCPRDGFCDGPQPVIGKTAVSSIFFRLAHVKKCGRSYPSESTE